MEKCHCNSPGFCTFYQKEMEADPPNWQWCQDASPEQRIKHKKDCEKKRIRQIFKNQNKRYVTIAGMVEDCKKHLLPKLSEMNIKGVAGIPRSGILPASICALFLNVPLYTIEETGCLKKIGSVSPDGGRRMKYYDGKEDGKIVILDDTVFSGEAMNTVLSTLTRDDVIFGAVYVHPNSLSKVDVYGVPFSEPYFLEWCLFNSKYMRNSYLDFDGILCPNVPHEIAIDEEQYVDYITNVEPNYDRLPKLFKCKGIITARLEKYRDITEEWLKSHEVNYGKLIMFPTERQEERDKDHLKVIGKFKGETFRDSDGKIFIESEIREASLIKRISKKIVICPDEEIFE